MIPGVDGIDGAHPQDLLNLGKRPAFQLQSEQLAAAPAQLSDRGRQPLEHLLAFDPVRGTGVEVRQGDVVDRHLSVLAVPGCLSPPAHHFIPDNLQGKRQQVLGAIEVSVFFVQEHEHLLRQVFGGLPR